MIQQLRVTVVVDNLVRGASRLGEHGWAVWIEADDRRLLFDTGQGHVLIHNLEVLKLDPGRIDAIVLSHGHYDHTGGLAAMLMSAPAAKMYVHPSALEPKYSRSQRPPHRFIGMSNPVADAVRSQPGRVEWTRRPTPIGDSVFVTGEIPRHTSFEDVGGPFYLDADCTRPDPLVDDQAVYLKTTRGLVVLLGCAHAGVVNTLDHVAALTGQDKILAVIGGMHLERATPQRLAATVAAFERYQVQHIVPGHCTGGAATARLWSEFPGRWQECHVGRRFDFSRQVPDS